MSEGTENAEAQKPSKYKGFGQKVWRVRPQGCTSCSAVQQALIGISEQSKVPETQQFPGLSDCRQSPKTAYRHAWGDCEGGRVCPPSRSILQKRKLFRKFPFLPLKLSTLCRQLESRKLNSFRDFSVDRGRRVWYLACGNDLRKQIGKDQNR